MGFAGIQTRDGVIIAPNDLPLYIGTDLNSALVNRSTSLTANTALANVFIGTPVILALAANSLIISNTIASGDIVIAGNRGGNSESYFQADVSAGDLFLNARGSGNLYLRTSDTARLYIGATSGFLTFNGAVTAPTAGTDEIRLAHVDFAAGDARLYIQAEAGGTTVLGNNTIRQLTGDLTISTAAATTDIVLRPIRAVGVALGATIAAGADIVSFFVTDVAAGDARLGIQAESGGITQLGNNAIRQVTSDLTITTAESGTDLVLNPNRRVLVQQPMVLGSSLVNSGTNILVVENGTAPTGATADQVVLYSSDNSAGNTIPSFYCEGTQVIATGQADSASSVRVLMRINGTVVTILCI